MRPSADVGIVGAGPAGARAAELLAGAGLEVVMLDPKAPWEKPCGGGLTPPAFDDVSELDELRSRAQPIDRVRVEVGPEEGFTVALERPMWVVPRLDLSRWQLERALAAGAAHLPVKVTSILRSYRGWLLETTDGPLTVPFLVGADGAASLVRRAAAPKFPVELAPTRVAYPRGAGPASDTALLRFYDALPGYLWDFPRPDHRSVGIGVPNGTWRRPRLDGEIDAYRGSSEPCPCPGLERAGAVIGTAQLGHGDFSRIAGDDFALLGDAAGFADPLTGEGIQNALRSAGLFVEAWMDGGVRTYPERARRAFGREFEVARVIRRSVFENEAGVRLVRKGLGSRGWYAVVAAMVNAVNEHDGNLLRAVRWWRSALRAARSSPRLLGPAVRTSVPCVCHGEGVTEEDCCSSSRQAA